MDILWVLRNMTGVLLCCFLFLFTNVAAENGITYIYLNSLENCGHDKTFPVDINNVYLIRPNADPKMRTHIFRGCDVTFHSENEDGHICIIEEGSGAKISDNNVELKVYDGVGNDDDELIGHLKPYPNRWPRRDVCSKQRYISLHLNEIHEDHSADINKVQIAFKIVDISSRERTLYLDGTYCDSHYDLLNSEISIFNRPRSTGSTVSSVKPECAMRFDKVDKNSNATICIAFIPSPDLACSNQWHLMVAAANFDLDDKFIVYSRHCSDPESKKMHVKCFSRENALITVALLRKKPSDRPGDFQIKVRDYVGTEENFLKEVKASLEKSDSPFLGQMEIILICVCVGLVLIIIIIIYCNRKKLPCSKYSVVEKKERPIENEL